MTVQQEKSYDLIIRAGTVGTAENSFKADVGVRAGRIVAIGEGLSQGRTEINADGKYVLPGGVDPHAHIEQLSAAGIMNADTWESATSAAAQGGTTTVIAFAAQHRGNNLKDVVNTYSKLAREGAIIDYAFHLIISDPTEETLLRHLPELINRGHRSIKVFMTYEKLIVEDVQLLDVLYAARQNRALVCVHAENHGMIQWMTKRLLSGGYVEPKYHSISHPRSAEAEAIQRLIHLAALIDQPIMVFHVSTAEGALIVRRARGEGLKVYAETCPQYLFFDASCLERPGIEGAKWICSPPPRNEADQKALWRALELGDLQVVSSDHAPYALDSNGKLRAGPTPSFKEIPSGVPGIELRLPLLFDAMVSKGRLGLEKFVELTATAPAKIYGLHPRKGAISVGADADIVVWDPEKEVAVDDSLVHDRTGFTPYLGRVVKGWPETVVLRGATILDSGQICKKPGCGSFVPMIGGAGATPANKRVPEVDPNLNFGAEVV